MHVLTVLVGRGVEANNNNSRVGTNAGYLSQAVLGGLYFTAVKKMQEVSFPIVFICVPVVRCLWDHSAHGALDRVLPLGSVVSCAFSPCLVCAFWRCGILVSPLHPLVVVNTSLWGERWPWGHLLGQITFHCGRRAVWRAPAVGWVHSPEPCWAQRCCMVWSWTSSHQNRTLLSQQTQGWCGAGAVLCDSSHHKFLTGCALLPKWESTARGHLGKRNGLKLSVILPVTLRALSEENHLFVPSLGCAAVPDQAFLY